MEALAEIDSCRADSRCLDNLLATASEFSRRLTEGQAFQTSDLCRVRLTSSLLLHDFQCLSREKT